MLLNGLADDAGSAQLIQRSNNLLDFVILFAPEEEANLLEYRTGRGSGYGS